MTLRIPEAALNQHVAITAKVGDLRTCPQCGTEFSIKPKQLKQRFCSRSCGLRAVNPPDHNARVARQTATKRGEKLRGRGTGKSYRKLNGRHAHRAIAELLIGRPLEPGEVVHHRDGNKLNNDPTNLEVLPSQSQHASIHFKGKQRRKRDVCRSGLHRMEGDNLIVGKDCRRACAACKAIAAATRYRAAKARKLIVSTRDGVKAAAELFGR